MEWSEERVGRGGVPGPGWTEPQARPSSTKQHRQGEGQPRGGPQGSRVGHHGTERRCRSSSSRPYRESSRGVLPAGQNELPHRWPAGRYAGPGATHTCCTGLGHCQAREAERLAAWPAGTVEGQAGPHRFSHVGARKKKKVSNPGRPPEPDPVPGRTGSNETKDVSGRGTAGLISVGTPGPTIRCRPPRPQRSRGKLAASSPRAIKTQAEKLAEDRGKLAIRHR